jgi:hypothetical protein
MWTATLTDKTLNNDGRLDLRFELSDGNRTIRKNLSTSTTQTETWLATVVKQWVSRLEELELYTNGLELGVIEYSTAPAPKELATQAWIRNYEMLGQMEKAVGEKLLAADDPAYLALQVTVKQTFLPDYTQYLRR